MPSWSWMSSYTSRVEFPKDHYGTLALNKNLSFHPQRKEALVSDLGTVTNCTLSYCTGDYILPNAAAEKVGWISLDLQSCNLSEPVHCVVVSRFREYQEIESHARRRYRVLVIISTGRMNEYRRIGFGTADVDYNAKAHDIVQII